MSRLPSDSCSKLHVTINSFVVQIKKFIFVTFVSIPSCSLKITFLLSQYLKFKFYCQCDVIPRQKPLKSKHKIRKKMTARLAMG